MQADDLSNLHCVQYVFKTGSTMDDLRLQAKAGAPEWTVILSETQTSGRGRRGKTWQSQSGAGLYFSVLLRPNLPSSSLGLLPLLVGSSLAKTIQNIGIPSLLKWSNDILTPDGRKLCGILLESEIQNNTVQYIILGIGINVRRQNFPPELNAAALEEFVPIHRRDVLLAILTNLQLEYQRFLVQPEYALSLWKSQPNTLGRQVTVLEPNGSTWTGTALDLDNSGALQIRTVDSIKTVYAAEISLRHG